MQSRAGMHRSSPWSVAALALVTALAACAESPEDVTVDPAEATAGAPDGKADSAATALPDVRCAGAPATGPRQAWRHSKNALVALASSRHRGFDVIASASDASQVLAGEASYGLADKALEDEQVELFACRAGAWTKVGAALTDGEGSFRLTLTGSRRLPIGLRDLYLSVAGDRTGTRFLAMVAPGGTALVVSDVDGTLTSSENAFPEALVTGASVAVHDRAPAAFNRLRARGYQPVYVTARGDVFTEDTRAWLAAVGLPRGPMRLAPHAVTLPGAPTVAFKAGVLFDLEAHGLDVAVGIGNRASDISAYGQAGVAARATWIKGPEFDGEVVPEVNAGRARRFAAYGDLTATIDALPVR